MKKGNIEIVSLLLNKVKGDINYQYLMVFKKNVFYKITNTYVFMIKFK